MAMENGWIVDVLNDLSSYSERNGLERTANALISVRQIVQSEIFPEPTIDLEHRHLSDFFPGTTDNDN